MSSTGGGGRRQSGRRRGRAAGRAPRGSRMVVGRTGRLIGGDRQSRRAARDAARTARQRIRNPRTRLSRAVIIRRAAQSRGVPVSVVRALVG